MCNLSLLTDLYELTMMQGYFLTHVHERETDYEPIVVFDMFFRENPFGSGYAVMAGLEQVIEYIENLHFGDEEIGYLSSLGLFKMEFLEYISRYRFSGDIYAIPEGTVVFPHEPLVRVKASITEAQILESALLNIINHQSLIATKAARVVWAAQGDGVLEFGLRRAQGPDAGVFGARAAVIGGCVATSNVLAGMKFNIPVRGTHAHSWVMSFPTEYEAFLRYAEIYPDNCILLVDTYDTLKSGIPNAIRVFNEMKSRGMPKPRIYGIRLDSGDLSYLSKNARMMLDEAGYNDAIISASDDLEENTITSLKSQGAKISLWGVGTHLITAADCPSFAGVYKLVAQESDDGTQTPKIKLSDNIEKVTNPGEKKIFRIYDKATGKIKADLITLIDEEIDTDQDLTIFDQYAVWKRMTLKAGEFTTRELLVPIIKNGETVYKSPSVMDIRDYCKKEMDTLWDEQKRLLSPHVTPVDLSDKLYELKRNMINNVQRWT
jgi:nicotinate phosphoribosyltransferase